MKQRHVLAAAVAAAVLGLELGGAFDRADERLADAMLRKRGEVEKTPRNVAIVGVTDSDLRDIGPWPWAPEVHAQLIETLSAAGVAGILWDLPLPPLKAGDAGAARLVAALAAAGNVLLPVSAAQPRLPEDGHGRLLAAEALLPDERLVKAAAGLGHVQVQADADGLVRALTPVLMGGRVEYPSLPLAGLARRVTAPGEALPSTPDGLAAKLDLTPDRRGRIRLKYYGKSAFEVQPYASVLSGDIGRAAFEGRLVLVGAATLGGHAQYPTPFGRLDRVLLLATAVGNGLEGQFLTPLPAWLAALLLAAVVLLGGRLVSLVGTLAGVALAGVALGAYGTLAWWEFKEAARLLPMTGVAFALTGAVLAPAAVQAAVRVVRRMRARPWTAITGFTREGPLVELATSTLGAGYTSISLLGAGGMGVVVKAVRTSDGRPVAVKLLSPQLAERKEERERFEREVQLLAALPHPGIVRLLSWDLTGLPHYTMDLVSGVSLAERLSRGPLPLAEVARAMVALAATLQFAHQHRCVHRDLKPANVLMDEQGGVTLIDFGAACRFDSALAHGEASAAGTPAYAAPETLDAATLPSPKLDVWGLGLLVYELLAGKLPWPSDAPLIGRADVSIAPLASVVPGVPAAVSEAVMAALAVDPRARPESPSVIAAALSPYRPVE